MIWVLLIISAGLCAAFLCAPLVKRPSGERPDTTFMPGLALGVICLFTLGTAAIYALVGQPKLSIKDNLKYSANLPNGTTPSADAQSGVDISDIDPNEITPSDISAMVEGLAARLREEPDDVEGWTRLIRSRIVIGDIPRLIADHKAMRDLFADRPDDILLISEQSGFNNFVARIVETQSQNQPTQAGESRLDETEIEQNKP